MAKNINNIHDKFFKEMMADKQNAIDFFQFFLPKNIVDLLDLKTLEQQKNSFTAPHLKEVFSDAIFLIRMANSADEVYISILLEHKSIKETYASFQILSYLSHFYEEQIKSRKPLKLILPFLFYHGKTDWVLKKIPDFFTEIPKELIPFVPAFDIFFIDLKKLDDEEIFSLMNTFLSSALIVQKYSNNPKDLVTQFIRIINTLSNYTNRNFFVSLIVYFFNNSELNEQKLIEILDKIPATIKSEIMSTYELIEQKGVEKGIKKGIEKGIEKGLNQVVLTAFKQGVDISLIANITNLNIEKVKSILAKEGLI